VADEFRSYLLPATDNPFAMLLASVRFDEVAKGRRGAVLVKEDATRGVPIVRTTTPYDRAAQRFGAIHDRLAHEIRRVAALACDVNNALVEHYTNAYSTMKRHSDQALDLATGSAIAIYSCYRDPQAPSRRLVVKPKGPAGAAFEIPLAHDSVVAFDLDTNRRFTHTIALAAKAPENDWLGVTFRTSKTFVRFVAGHAELETGSRLTLADEHQRRALFQLRGRENAEPDFTYPALAYTISPSDLLPPTAD
jgi:hypothetical protein